jgi:hypothetical protein
LCRHSFVFDIHSASVFLPSIDKRYVCRIFTITRTIRPAALLLPLLAHFCHHCQTRQGSALLSRLSEQGEDIVRRRIVWILDIAPRNQNRPPHPPHPPPEISTALPRVRHRCSGPAVDHQMNNRQQRLLKYSLKDPLHSHYANSVALSRPRPSCMRSPVQSLHGSRKSLDQARAAVTPPSTTFEGKLGQGSEYGAVMGKHPHKTSRSN